MNGVATYTYAMARALVGAGMKVTVISRDHGLPAGDLDRDLSVTRLTVSRDDPLLYQPQCLDKLLGGLWWRLKADVVLKRDLQWVSKAQEAFQEIHRNHPVDLVEYHDGHFPGLWAGMNPGVPCVVTLHSARQVLAYAGGGSLTLRDRLYDRLERYAARQASLLICPSRAIRDLAQRGWPDVRKPYRVIPNPFPFELRPLEEMQQESEKKILFYAQLSPWKAPDLLVKAFAKAAGRFPDWRLEIAGADSWPKQPFSEQIAAYRLAESVSSRITLIGQVPHRALASKIRESAVCVFPSRRFDNFPYSCMEAMGLGKAIVASRVGGMPEMLAEGECGRLFASGDVEALAACLAELMEDAALRAELGRRARQRVQAEYDPRKIARRKIEVFQRIVENRFPLE